MSNRTEACSGRSKQQIKDDLDAGIKAAKKALSEDDAPLFLMDEMPGLTMEADVFAMGWNSVCVSDENRNRFQKLKSV